MTHHCDYCDKELSRLMFCNHSHQVMYHRKGRVDETSITKPIKKQKKMTRKEYLASLKS